MFGSPQITECCTQEQPLMDKSVHQVKITHGASWYAWSLGEYYIVEYIAETNQFKVIQSNHFINPDHCVIIESF